MQECNVCVEICPNGIFRTDNNLLQSNLNGLNSGFIMWTMHAACSEKAIQVLGLDYNKDFFDLPETINSLTLYYFTFKRRSVRALKITPIPKYMLEQIVKCNIIWPPPSFSTLKN